MQERLAEIPSAYDEILESMSEDDKEAVSDALNDTNDAFVFKNIKSVLKTLRADKDTNQELIEALKKADQLNADEKNLKNRIKKQEEELHLLTKQTIEQLTDEQVRTLLHEKWANPVVDGIKALSDDLLDSFAKEIEALANKYSVTMSDLETEIRQTEKSLADMLGDLTGSEADMKGIRELRLLLGGAEDE